ncbi:MAG: MerR family transcriptional regulator [Gammaproteobacteria bacterium]|nr:MerR family transcriptional regulator [Gammaproteobacteria bacterium]
MRLKYGQRCAWWLGAFTQHRLMTCVRTDRSLRCGTALTISDGANVQDPRAEHRRRAAARISSWMVIRSTKVECLMNNVYTLLNCQARYAQTSSKPTLDPLATSGSTVRSNGLRNRPNKEETMYQISEAAALSGLTIRALRHYDAIGLLQPVTRSDAGYRFYGNDDVEALQRIRRYQGYGFSLHEIGELLTAKAPDRLKALRNQRDAVRQRASDTAQVVQAINQEITMENNGEKEPTNRLGRAQGLYREYHDRSKSEPVPSLSPLLVDALDLLRPLTETKSMDPDAVKLAALIHHCRNDNANLADLCQRFLDQEPNPDDRAFAVIDLVNALTFLGRYEDAVAIHRAHIEHVMDSRPATEWADTMDISSTSFSWSATDRRDEWLRLFRSVNVGVAPTDENRASRYELCHTAIMVMGGDDGKYADDIVELTGQMAEIIAEDPAWSERRWAEQRFEQQKVGNALRSDDPEAVTETVDAYRSFLEQCDWPVEFIATAYSNLGAMMHWDCRDEVAVECFVRAQQDGELDGYGYAWFASASLGNGAPRERVTELLAESGRRLESADAMRIFNEDSLLSAQPDREDLLNALLEPR